MVFYAVLEGVEAFLVATAVFDSEVDVEVLYAGLVGQELRVACELMSVVHVLDVLPQPCNQVLHVFQLEILSDGLGIDLRLQCNPRPLPLRMVGQLLISDTTLEVEVIIMNAHEFHLFFVILLHHLSIYRTFLLRDAHFRTLFEEFAGLGVAQGEIGAAELEVAPDLEVLEFVDPGCCQGFADQGDYLRPLAEVGFEFDHQDQVNGYVFLQLQAKEEVQHALAYLLSPLVAAIDGMQVNADIHEHQFHRNRVLVTLQKGLIGSKQFLAIRTSIFQLLYQQCNTIIVKSILLSCILLLQSFLHAEDESLLDEVAIVARAVAHEALEFPHDGAVALDGGIKQVCDDFGGLAVEFADCGWQSHRVELHQVFEDLIGLVAVSCLCLRLHQDAVFEGRSLKRTFLGRGRQLLLDE